MSGKMPKDSFRDVICMFVQAYVFMCSTKTFRTKFVQDSGTLLIERFLIAQLSLSPSSANIVIQQQMYWNISLGWTSKASISIESK